MMVSLRRIKSYSLSVCLFAFTIIFGISLYIAVFHPENLTQLLVLGVVVSGFVGTIIAVYDFALYSKKITLNGQEYEIGDPSLGLVWEKREIDFDLDVLNLLSGVKESNDDFVDVSTSSDNLNRFKDIIHPVRLSAMKLLYLFDNLDCTTIKDHLDLPWSDSEPHLRYLHEEGYIRIVDHLVNPINQTVYITHDGREMYKELFDTLQRFVASHFIYSDTSEDLIHQ